jgi:hypothetical protein
MVSYQGLIEQDRVDINPKSLGIDQDLRAISFPDKLDVHSDIKAFSSSPLFLYFVYYFSKL